MTGSFNSLRCSSFRRKPESSRDAHIKFALSASIALHAAVVAALVPFRYPPPATAEAPIEITVIATAAGEPAERMSQAAPAQDAATPEQPVPTAVPPGEVAPVPTEAAQVVQPPPTEIVPQAVAPPEPEQIAVMTPPPPAAAQAAQSHPTPAKVAVEQPRVVKAAARVTPSPNPLPQAEGEVSASASTRAASALVSADALSKWQAALIAWLDAHRAYPEAARQRAEQGAVGVRFTLSENGDVTNADIQRGSGSTTLDDATLDMLRGAHLPPPPQGTDPARRTISVSIRYKLDR